MCADQEFHEAPGAFPYELQKLAKTLTALEEDGWVRRGTFTGTSPCQHEQTVSSYSEHFVNHELMNPDLRESLLC